MLNPTEVAGWTRWDGLSPTLSAACRDRESRLEAELEACLRLVLPLFRQPDTRAEAEGCLSAWQGLPGAARAWVAGQPAFAAWVTELRRQLTRTLRSRKGEGELLACVSDLMRFVCAGALQFEENVTVPVTLDSGRPLVLPGHGLALVLEEPKAIPVRLATVSATRLDIVAPSFGSVLTRIDLETQTIESLTATLRVRLLKLVRIPSHRHPLIVDFVEPWLVADHYPRYPGGLTAEVATESDMGRWSEALPLAVRLIRQVDPLLADELHAVVRTIVPLVPLEGYHVSSTTAERLGAVGCSWADPCALAEALVHEYGHSKLYLLQRLVSILAPDAPAEAVFFSPWRPDPRPLNGLLHGAFVAVFVARFWQRAWHVRRESEDRQRWAVGAARCAAALAELTEHGLFTPEGGALLRAMVTESRTLTEPLVRDPEYLAEVEGIATRRQTWLESHGTNLPKRPLPIAAEGVADETTDRSD